MRLPRRQFLHLTGAALALPFVSMARAQAYPARPVRLILGYPPGGSADITARLMGQWLTERLGQSVVIENRPGAGTNLATETAVPDERVLVGTPVAGTQAPRITNRNANHRSDRNDTISNSSRVAMGLTMSNGRRASNPQVARRQASTKYSASATSE